MHRTLPYFTLKVNDQYQHISKQKQTQWARQKKVKISTAEQIPYVRNSNVVRNF